MSLPSHASNNKLDTEVSPDNLHDRTRYAGTRVVGVILRYPRKEIRLDEQIVTTTFCTF